MMAKLSNVFFGKYVDRDYMDNQKARVIVFMILLITATFGGMFYNVAIMQGKGFTVTIIGIIVIQFVFIAALFLVRSGYLNLSAHMILVPMCILIWVTLFTNSGFDDVLKKANTMVYVFPLITLVTLLTTRAWILIYSGVNMGAFILFNIFFFNSGHFTRGQMLDNMLDGSFSILIVAATCYFFAHISRKSQKIVEETLEENTNQGNSIRHMLSVTGEMAEKLAVTTDQMAATTSSFSNSAQNQAASVEEISANIEEVSAGGESVYGMAQKQAELVNRVSDEMEKLSGIVSRVETQMKEALTIRDILNQMVEHSRIEIEESIEKMSRSTSKFQEVKNMMDLIEDISGQINLLSLNAAIEAARAGDMGRGFGVVADEIGKLAENTSSNVKAIHDLFTGSNDEIVSANNQLDLFVGSLNNIIHNIIELSEKIDDVVVMAQEDLEVNETVRGALDVVISESNSIREATSEQKIALDDIASSISQLNRITQEIAIGSEELSTSSNEIARSAQELSGIEKMRN